MEQWIISLMSQFGYFGVFFLIFIENMFPPIPSEVILAFGGFTTTVPAYNMTIIGVIGSATLGSVLGAILLYWIGFTFNVDVIERFIAKWGHLLRLKVEDIEKADRWFKKRGILTVFVCRMIPVLRSLISIPAGMSKMKFRTFLVFTVLGTLIWNTLLVYAGAALGANWRSVLAVLTTYQDLTLVVLVTLFVIGVIWLLRKSKTKTVR